MRVGILGISTLFVLLLGSLAAQPDRSVQSTIHSHTFALPPGFTIELAAGPPLVERPITADLDEQGNLYVTESSGTNDNVQEQLKKKPHRVLRLTDTDGDGKYDRRTVFADNMMFPEGSLWHAGSLYVAAPPSIWKLTDTDGDGVADQRVEWFQGKTLTGCANDLHGPYFGLDGRIYWCKGAFAKQTYIPPTPPSKGREKTSDSPPLEEGVRGVLSHPFETRASHIFRCRPDGTGLEPVMTGGMDNPVDVVFTPSGERIFTTTFFQHPGNGQRDGLIHAIYGGIYGKDHEVIHDPAHKWTAPSVMPVLTHMGAAAPCGLARYESAAFGAEYKDNFFACQFNMHKVSRHVLITSGATFKTRDEDFLVSNNLDFHPTDVLEDADGSLLVVDTGGWYKLCCPTSQLHKPDVLGAIYRVRRTNAAKLADPYGLRLKVDVRSLADPRPFVRRRAMRELAQPNAVPDLARLASSHPAADTRLAALWTLTRIETPEARTAARRALTDADATVRQAALHAVSLHRDALARDGVAEILTSGSPQQRRAAAEALGRIGDPKSVPALLRALAESNDRALEHALIFALIEIGHPQATAAGLLSSSSNMRRGSLIALDQMTDGRLNVRPVLPELSANDPALREAAWWICSRHAEWATELAGVLRERLQAKALSDAESEELVQFLARFARTPTIQTLLVATAQDSEASATARSLALRAMARSGLRDTPAPWLAALTRQIQTADAALLPESITTLRALTMPKQRPQELADALTVLGEDASRAEALRLSALAAVPSGLDRVSASTFALLREQLQPDKPVTQRSLGVDVIARSKLTSEQLLALTDDLKAIGPIELDRLLEAFTQSGDERVGLALCDALKSAPALSALRVETLKPRLAKQGPAVQHRAEEIYARLNVDAAQQKAKLDELLATLKEGDIRRGQLVFNGTKAACASCHAVGYLGGKVGPDLTQIARIRTERDLLEAIVFPSASFVRSYEPVVVLTQDGQTLNGILKKDAPEEVVLTLTADKELRIAREDIAAMKPSKTSIMPAGLDQQLTLQELADLVAFLKACK